MLVWALSSLGTTVPNGRAPFIIYYFITPVQNKSYSRVGSELSVVFMRKPPKNTMPTEKAVFEKQEPSY